MRNRRTLVLAVLAVALGTAAVLVQQRMRPEPETRRVVVSPELETVTVVSAAKNLAAGSRIEASDVEVSEWPAAYAPKGVLRDAALAKGRVVRRPLAGGEPLFEAALLPVGSQAGLAPIIENDHRAVSVKVDPVIGVAGFVNPGSRVDVVATLRDTGGGRREAFTKTVVQDVRVLAIDQSSEQTRDGRPEIVSVVTLEVDPGEAQRISYAAHEGKLQLALRNPIDAEVVATRSIGAGDLRDEVVVAEAKTGRQVEIIKGLDISHRTF